MVVCVPTKTFYQATGLTEATLGDKVASIGDSAFVVVLPLNLGRDSTNLSLDSVNCWVEWLEGASSLGNVILGEKVSQVPTSAFKNCGSLYLAEINAKVLSAIFKDLYDNRYGY